MKTISFVGNVDYFSDLLEELKVRLVKLCAREADKGPPDISVIRYNMARQELKGEFPLEVICMLDGSSFIHEILSEPEKKWMDFRRNEKKKGGRS